MQERGETLPTNDPYKAGLDLALYTLRRFEDSEHEVYFTQEWDSEKRTAITVREVISSEAIPGRHNAFGDRLVTYTKRSLITIW